MKAFIFILLMTGISAFAEDNKLHCETMNKDEEIKFCPAGTVGTIVSCPHCFFVPNSNPPAVTPEVPAVKHKAPAKPLAK